MQLFIFIECSQSNYRATIWKHSPFYFKSVPSSEVESESIFSSFFSFSIFGLLSSSPNYCFNNMFQCNDRAPIWKHSAFLFQNHKIYSLWRKPFIFVIFYRRSQFMIIIFNSPIISISFTWALFSYFYQDSPRVTNYQKDAILG